jgi:hypothetical protein
MRKLMKALSLSVLVIAAARVAGAQDAVFDASGFHQNREYFTQAPFEHVDTVTGNLILTFTDLAISGSGGTELRFQRTYNSKQGGGWTFGLAGVPWVLGDQWPPPQGIQESTWATIRMADGSGYPRFLCGTIIWHDRSQVTVISRAAIACLDSVSLRRLDLRPPLLLRVGDGFAGFGG